MVTITLLATRDRLRAAKERTGLGESHQVKADALELGRWHGDRGRVIRFWNAKVLLVNIHQLQVILGQAIRLGALELQVQYIWRILRLERQDIVVLGSSQDLGKRSEVDTESNVAVTAVGSEPLGLEHHADERDVGVVHGLEGDAGVITVEVAVLDEVLDSVDDLLEELGLLKTCFKHCDKLATAYAHFALQCCTLCGAKMVLRNNLLLTDLLLGI